MAKRASTSESAAPTASKAMLWTGRAMSTLLVLVLLVSASMKLLRPPSVLEAFAHLGYPEHLALPIGIIEVTCTILYAIPRTSVLGAILLTGYLGGAVATHLRIGEPVFGPVILGLLVWGGLFFRDERLRTLLPPRG